jgi:[protein-PII] uridylyltransferase
MSNTAQSRDLSDRHTIETFAKLVQTLERLKLLLALTVADIRAVGPNVWNGWKGELLRTLYWETEVVLAGGHSALDRNRRVARAKQELRDALPEWTNQTFEAYAARHYQAYWLRADLPHKIQHARLLQDKLDKTHPLATEVSTDGFRGITELTVVAPDHPKFLSIIAGACASAGANIVDAQIFTTADGLALDTISVSRAFQFDEDEARRGGRIAQAIERALRGDIRIGDVVAAKDEPKTREKTFHIAPEVTIDNSLSNTTTVVEVSGLDRPGLLYGLTRAIARLNLNIRSAHIVTFGEKAVDVFYVTDLTGTKIVSPSRQAAIRKHLLEVFAPAKIRGAA